MVKFAKVYLSVFLLPILLIADKPWSVQSWSPTHRVKISVTRSRMSSTISDAATAEEVSATIPVECNEVTKTYFAGKNILLTGATGGLGKSFALLLANCKAKNIVLSARNREALEQLTEECKNVGQPDLTTHIITCDLGNMESVTELGEEAIKVVPGGIDVLINNGGVSSRSSFLDTKLEVDEMVMQINFFAGVNLAKRLVPGMVERKSGSIIWISSVQGLVGIPNRTSYAASKFAVQGYCEALRAELAASGVSVHVASPGYIRTNLSRSAIKGDGQKHGKMDETTANGADPNETAASILDSVSRGKADFVVASTTSAKAAIWLRFLAPSFLNSMLVKRYEKSLQQEEE